LARHPFGRHGGDRPDQAGIDRDVAVDLVSKGTERMVRQIAISAVLSSGMLAGRAPAAPCR
jgi:hypothetical protein